MIIPKIKVNLLVKRVDSNPIIHRKKKYFSLKMRLRAAPLNLIQNKYRWNAITPAQTVKKRNVMTYTMNHLPS